MTWLYVPNSSSTSCPSALAEPDSISASSWQCQQLERCVTSNGKRMPSRYWSRAYKKKSWTAHLFGPMLPPSTAARGVASWILLLRATRASHSQALAEGWPLPTPDISGRALAGLSARYGQGSVSSRTWQTTLISDSRTLETTYRSWVIALQRDCTRRLRQVRRMNARGFLFWPTPTATNPNEQESVESWEVRRAETARRLNNGNGFGIPLAIAAKVWPTPTATDGSNGGPNSRGSAGQLKLPGMAAQWPTPRASDTNGPGIHGTRGQDLRTVVMQWSTPRSHESGNWQQDKAKDRVPKLTLSGQATLWQSSTVQDCTNKANLDQTIEYLPGPLDQMIEMVGDNTSTDGRVLNPRFVEALMGWPIGWTVCAPLGTEWSRWWQLWRSLIFGMSCMDNHVCDV